MNEMPNQNTAEATELLDKTFFLVMDKWKIHSSFILLAKYGTPYAKPKYQEHMINFFATLENDPEMSPILSGLREIHGIENEFGWDYLVEQMTDSAVIDYELAVNSASIIFAHSILDTFVTECCMVSIIMDPNDWVKQVKDKTLKLKDIKDSSYQEILNNKLNRYIDKELQWLSLIKKLDLIVNKISFQSHFERNWDRKKINKFDKVRHETVHGDQPINKLSNVISEVVSGIPDLQLLSYVLPFFVALRYGLKIDANLHPRHRVDKS